MRVLQAERKAVSLGDGVYHQLWDPDRQRVRVRTYDPGSYFPVLPEDGDGAEYPQRVHLAWELPEDKKRGLPAWLRPATGSGVDREGRPVRAVLISDPGDDTPPTPLLGRGDQVDSTGAISRTYPWDNGPSYRTCYLTDATWELGDLKGPIDVDSLPMDEAHFATGPAGEVLDHLDLLIDFVPVVHVPNTVPPPEEHWGQSSLAKVLQVFDEIAGTDTDSAKASATTGSPIISISGRRSRGRQNQMAVAPGMGFELDESGRMDVLDTPPQLAELRNHAHDLSDRASNVARLPAVSLGTMDPPRSRPGTPWNCPSARSTPSSPRCAWPAPTSTPCC